MSTINVTRDFIDKKEISFYINLINQLEKDKLQHFSTWQNGNRIALSFGNSENDYQSNISARPNFDILSGAQVDAVRSLISRVVENMKTTYEVEGKLYVCSFWFAKQYPGGVVLEHEDTDEGINMHFEHSVLLYLNTVTAGGELVFTDLGTSHKPRAGDLVSFRTVGTGKHSVPEVLEDRYSLVFWTTKDKNYEL